MIMKGTKAMKKFNQMTETQMSKTDGGILLSTIIGAFCTFVACTGVGGAIYNAAKK